MSHRYPVLCASALALVLGLVAREAHAFDVQVSSSTTAQGYSVRSPFGDPILARRRFLQTLGLNLTGIEGDDADAKGPRYSVRVLMRFDADFGVNDSTVTYASGTSSYIPGLQRDAIDLMVGYLDASNLADGLLSMRLGRQYVVDTLGYWSFDGGLLRSELPFYLAMETYGGFEQRGGLPASTPRFERDGVWRGDRSKLDGTLYPAFQQAAAAPAFGVAVESLGVKFAHARVAYRKVYNTGSVTTLANLDSPTSLPPSYTGWRTSSERLAASGDLHFDKIGAMRTGAVYDLYSSLVSSYYGTIDGFVSKDLVIGSDFDRFVPTFDGDSIFNWFAHDPMSTWTTRAEASLTRRIDMAASAGMRWVQSSSTSSSSTSTSTEGGDTMFDGLGRLSGRYRWAGTTFGLSGMTERGERGKRDGADLYAEKWLDRRYMLSARTSLYDWHDALRPDRSATSFGYVLGGGFRPSNTTQLLIEWEHDTNRLVGQRYRVMAMLQVLVSK